MRRVLSVVLLAAVGVVASACSSASSGNSTAPSPVFQSGSRADQTLVEFEMMTWPEVKTALAAGKTTALFYTGGTEQRGPQNVNGGHTLMGRATVRAIALKLGNAIAMPVLPYTPNRASATLPGTIGLTDTLLMAVLERVTEEAISTGFKNVVVMGDHGGGQPNSYRDVAKRLDDKHAKDGVHVFFCDSVYSKANADFDKWLTAHGYPTSSHAGIPDTSEMIYLGGRVLGSYGAPPHRRRRHPAARRGPGSKRGAREQWHFGRRTTLHRRAGENDLRHEGRLRREADSRLHRQDALTPDGRADEWTGGRTSPDGDRHARR
jgi:creatinine amidohydrolase/Fe(II)-dependent formamide hydrolase-like protein